MAVSSNPYVGDLKVDLQRYDFSFSLKNKLGRVIWFLAYWIFFRPFNLTFFSNWRAVILRIFGAEIGKNSNIYASVKIWAPWNLKVGTFTTIGPKVDCYNQGRVVIGSHVIVSQKSYICASSHDCTISNFPLIVKPITIEDQVWIAADAFIGPGVTVHEGAVVGARSSVFRDVTPWTIVGGNPSNFIKNRIMRS
ncbi:putative colanic acid biosynthesis acetyltransferase [Salinimicrobium sp. GXAS 041]|uniref:putative colanic acid biosynthesis acetyltransferase n=1 Tax=Salinimicrobium sp. GXAS 041 TaxID=3400806 RepID=UPI003C782635